MFFDWISRNQELRLREDIEWLTKLNEVRTLRLGDPYAGMTEMQQACIRRLKAEVAVDRAWEATWNRGNGK